MIAILIFAGRSRRFWPLKEKSFFPVCGTTLLQEQVRRLRDAGVKKILLVAGAHNKAQAKRLFPSLQMVEQADLDLGMRGALLSALPICGKGPVMVVSSNDLIDASAYRALCVRAKVEPKTGLILARQVSTYFPGGYLSLQKKRITGIVEKPVPGTEPSSFVNIVAHVHPSAPKLLAALKHVKSTRDDGYEAALAALFVVERYEAVLYEGSWHAIKYPWHLLSLLPSLLPQGKGPKIARSASIHASAVIEGSVVISEGVRVMPHATIIGPCYIGPHTIIANNTLVRGSSIGARCVIGYNTEIARSMLGDDVWTHSSYVGDSVFANNISLGAGTTTGNLRLNEGEIVSIVEGKKIATGCTKLGAVIGEGCRLGIHTCLFPGVKIGGGTFVSSSTLVSEDVPERSFVKEQRSLLVIRENKEHATLPKDRKEFRKKLG